MQNWIDHHQSAVWIIFPLYFAALWCLVSAVLSYIGGWNALADRFRSHSDFAGERWSFQSGQMRWRVDYRNCLTVGASMHGLYLAVLPLFRFRSPPLLIPWEEITVARQQLLFRQRIRLSLGRELNIPLSISPTLAGRLQAAAGSRWPAA